MLAALYESWAIPLSVMLVMPLGLVGAVAAVLLRGLENDVFFKVGLITIVGLSAKNAILIVEFAKGLLRDGHSLSGVVVEADRLRLRPILRTSLAFDGDAAVDEAARESREIAKLRKLVADVSLDREMLQDIVRRKI